MVISILDAQHNGGKKSTIGTLQGGKHMHEWNIKVIKDSASEKSNKVVKGELGEKSCADFIANYISESLFAFSMGYSQRN